MLILKKAFVYDPIAKNRLHRAARAIQRELIRRKLLKNRKPLPLDSAHLEKAMEHHLANGSDPGEGLLKIGMMLRGSDYGQISQSDIDLLNMLPFHIKGHTIEHDQKSLQKSLDAHNELIKALMGEIEQSKRARILLDEKTIQEKLARAEKLAKEIEKQQNVSQPSTGTGPTFSGGNTPEYTELREIIRTLKQHNLEKDRQMYKLQDLLYTKAELESYTPPNRKFKIPLRLFDKPIIYKIQALADMQKGVKKLQHRLKFLDPDSDSYDTLQKAIKEEIEEKQNDIQNYISLQINTDEDFIKRPNMLRYINEISQIPRRVLNAVDFIYKPIRSPSNMLMKHFATVFPSSSPDEVPINVGPYIQTALKYGPNQGIMDWMRKYAVPLSHISKKRKFTLYHGSGTAFRMYDPDSSNMDHYYPVGLFANTHPFTPITFSHKNAADIFYIPRRGLSGPIGSFAVGPKWESGQSFLHNTKLLHKIIVPRSLKFLSHDTDYTNTSVPRQMAEYIDDIAERTGRTDLKGIFQKALNYIDQFPRDNPTAYKDALGTYYDHQDQDFMPSYNSSTNQQRSDQETDAMMPTYSRNNNPLLNCMDKFAEDSPMQEVFRTNNDRGKLFGYKLYRAATMAFEALGARKQQDHGNPSSSGYVYDFYKTPYRTTTYHTGMMLSSLGFSGYRHLDPETHDLIEKNSRLRNWIKLAKGGLSNIRSYALLPSAFTELPMAEHRLKKDDLMDVTPPFAVGAVRGEGGKFERPYQIDYGVGRQDLPERIAELEPAPARLPKVTATPDPVMPPIPTIPASKIKETESGAGQTSRFGSGRFAR